MVLAIVGTIVIGLWAFQRRLIYLPDTTRPPVPSNVTEVTLTTGDDLELAAWWLTPARGASTAVVVLPGNAGNRADRLPLGHRLVDEGLAVLLVDYRGYGGNPGSPSESGLLADARAARRWVDAHGDVDHVVYFGESIGSGPAVALATESPPSALVLRSPFPSLPDVAAVHYPLVPAGLLLRDRFPIAEQVAGLDVPTVVVAGSADSIIPLSQSRAVAETAHAEMLVLEGTHHNDPELTFGPEVVEAVLSALEG